MFCSKCGQQIPDNSSFCMYCGATFNGSATPVSVAPAVDYQVEKNKIRQSELNALNDVYNYFCKKNNQYIEYDNVCKELKHYARGAKNALLIWGCIIFSIALFIGMICFNSDAYEGFKFMLYVGMLPALAMIAGGILMKVNNAKQMEKYRQEYARLSTELYTYYLNYTNCPVGPEYSNPNAIRAIITILNSGRADTVKDSINLTLTNVGAKKVNNYLSVMESLTRNINIQTGVSAIFAASELFY